MVQRRAAAGSYKLDETDYENIYLRVSRRLLKTIFGAIVACFTAFGIVSAWAAYERINAVAEAGVNKYVQSAEFKQYVQGAYEQRLAQLEKRAADVSRLLADQERHAANMAQGSTLIDAQGIVITSADGKRFNIETGVVGDGGSVEFKNHFVQPPVVLLTPSGETLNSITYREMARGGAIFGADASDRGFQVRPEAGFGRRSFRWVAIGP